MQSQSDELQEDKEMKRLFVALMLIAFVTTGAFAQIVLGVTGVQYYQEDASGKLPTLSESWADFKEGTGVYWGGYAEIILGKLGLGLSFNQQTYKDPWELATTGGLSAEAFDQWNYDINFFMSYHLFGGRAFIDPFLQAGVGMLAYDWKNKDMLATVYDVSEDPMMASAYFDFGFGLGINLGGIGIFAKGMWNVKSNEPITSSEDVYGVIYEIPDWPVMPFKWVFGAKLIL